jgi:type IV secretory pathway TraG/TraD family ATPase VirD4
MSLENEKDLDGEKIRRIIFVLDEFQKLGKITTIEELLTVQRSKGGSTILATQSIAKLEDIYGKLLTLSLIQNLSTKVIMQYDEQIGNDIFTKILGKQEVVENNENRIVSQNHTRDTSNKTEKNVEKNIIIDGELSSLKPLSAFIRISNYPIGEVSFKYREITPINKLDESNIYTPLKYEIFEDNMEVVEDVEILITQEDKIPDYAMPLEEHYIGNECNIDGSETQIIMNDNFNSEWEFKDER